MLRAPFILIACSLPFVLSGCGGSELEKVVVRGAVLFDGKPVENGEILFYPLKGTVGPVSGASIREGRYVADGKGGVPVGKHEVRIRGFAISDAARRELADNPDAKVGRLQYIPEKYNESSELTFDAPLGGGSIEKDFTLAP